MFQFCFELLLQLRSVFSLKNMWSLKKNGGDFFCSSADILLLSELNNVLQIAKLRKFVKYLIRCKQLILTKLNLINIYICS